MQSGGADASLWRRRGLRTALLILALAPAAQAHAADDGQLWTTTSATVKLSDRWRLSEEAIARFSGDRNGLYEIEVSSLLGYRIGTSVTLWAGYTHNPNYSGGDFTVMEHRAREQVTFDNFASLGRGRLSGRLRMEQRWREGSGGTGWRVRPYVKYSLPLAQGARTALIFSTEAFVNLNTTSFQRTDGLDRTRTLIGLSTPIAKNISGEIGYLNQHIFVPNGPDSDDHVASIALSFAL